MRASASTANGSTTIFQPVRNSPTRRDNPSKRGPSAIASMASASVYTHR
jgi:hypothetical protein